MSTHFNDIMGALESHLSSMPTNTPIAWPGVEFDQDGEYMQVVHLPGETTQAALGDNGDDVTLGIMQVNVYTPENTGRSTVHDSTADHFRRGLYLEQNGVVVRLRGSSLGPQIRDGAHFMRPLSVKWRAFTRAR